MQRLRAIIIEEPFYQLQTPHVARCFTDVMDLKRRGYAAEYPDTCLPVDTTDFIGAHVAVCQENEAGSTPLLACKFVSLEQCDRFGIPFPPLEVLEEARLPHVRDAVEAKLSDARREGRVVFYDSAWTIDPEARKRPRLAQALRAIFTAVGYYYHVHKQASEWFAFAVRRFKSHELFTWLGAETLVKEFPARRVGHEPVAFMHHRRYPAEVVRLIEQQRLYWEDCRVWSPARTTRPDGQHPR